MHLASSVGSLLKSTLNDSPSFSKCSDICTLHVCKLCSNSSDEFQFQAFLHFLPGLHGGAENAGPEIEGPSVRA